MSTPPAPGQEEVQTISFVEIPSSGTGRIGKTDVLVTYKFDEAHVFQVTVPKEQFNEATVDAMIRADFKEKRKYIGRKVKI